MIGAASQRKISAKRVWRTALKDHRAGVLALMLTEEQLLNIRLVLQSSI